MARKRRRNVFNYKYIEAFLSTPLIVLGDNKRTRRSAARKWLKLFEYGSKH